MATADKQLKYIYDNFGAPSIQKREQGFTSMCHIILEQQVSIAAAKACYLKLENHFGIITPLKIINSSDIALRNCGISRQKIVYLRDLADKVETNKIDFLSFKNKTEAQIRAELLTIKGVGNWSIDVYLMFCLQQNDIFPVGDIAIKNTMVELYQTTATEQMELISARWKPYRTFATYLLWHYYLTKRGRI